MKRVLVFFVAAAVTLGAALLVDHWVFANLHIEKTNTDFFRLLRVMGYVPTWLLVAGAFLLLDWPRWWERALWLVASVLAGGAAAEVMKILARRLRPSEASLGQYQFRRWSEDFFDSGGLGLPSSHTAVAFAAAWMLCKLHPRAWPIFIIAAMGCGFSRLAAGAHYVSDTVAAAALAWITTELLARLRKA